MKNKVLYHSAQITFPTLWSDPIINLPSCSPGTLRCSQHHFQVSLSLQKLFSYLKRHSSTSLQVAVWLQEEDHMALALNLSFIIIKWASQLHSSSTHKGSIRTKWYILRKNFVRVDYVIGYKQNYSTVRFYSFSHPPPPTSLGRRKNS